MGAKRQDVVLYAVFPPALAQLKNDLLSVPGSFREVGFEEVQNAHDIPAGFLCQRYETGASLSRQGHAIKVSSRQCKSVETSPLRLKALQDKWLKRLTKICEVSYRNGGVFIPDTSHR